MQAHRVSLPFFSLRELDQRRPGWVSQLKTCQARPRFSRPVVPGLAKGGSPVANVPCRGEVLITPREFLNFDPGADYENNGHTFF
jgi:hypothetical protein